eukprot:4499869-Amphidinium_carterae.1
MGSWITYGGQTQWSQSEKFGIQSGMQADQPLPLRFSAMDLWCMLRRVPSQAEVAAFRKSTACLWHSAPLETLIEVSGRAGVPP